MINHKMERKKQTLVVVRVCDGFLWKMLTVVVAGRKTC